VEYKRHAVAYPLHDFYKICRICTSFQDALAIKVSLDLLKGLWSYGGFNLTGSGYPQIFNAPSGETLLKVRVCSPDFAMKALDNRNDLF